MAGIGQLTTDVTGISQHPTLDTRTTYYNYYDDITVHNYRRAIFRRQNYPHCRVTFAGFPGAHTMYGG